MDYLTSKSYTQTTIISACVIVWWFLILRDRAWQDHGDLSFSQNTINNQQQTQL